MGSPEWQIEHDATGRVLVVDADGHDDQTVTAVVAEHVDAGEIGSVWVDQPPDGLDERLTALRWVAGREVLRIERPLPVPDDLAGPRDLPTRSFEVGVDEAHWVEVNNAAFAGHREQSGWTVERVRELEAEGWFDPDGFLLHEVDGRLAGFCWTKPHPDELPPSGEIYVIAVHPDFGGRRLGHRLTLAGLDDIHHRQGFDHGILYVDADNHRALRMYDGLGFRTARRRRLYLPAP